jgi:hypothetical protein
MPSPLALALMQGQSAGSPTQPFRATVAPTDVTKAYSDYNNAMEQAYQAKVAQQNSMWGGLAGLGSAGLLALSGGTLAPLLAGAGGLAALSSGSSIPGAVGPTSVNGGPLQGP